MTDAFRTAHVLVRVRPAADASRWVVTFDNFGLGPGLDRAGFGERFLEKYGVSAVHVMGVGDDWYQYPEMTEAMGAVRRVTEGAGTVMTYGSSMGGYAALRFAEAARATATLALSPQHNIDPSRPPFDDRWSQAAGAIRWLPELSGPLRPGAGRPPVVVYDSCSTDAAQVAAIAAEIEITPIALPYGGHPISSHLTEIGLLRPLFFDVLEDRLDARAFRARARARRNTPVYLTEVSQAAAPRRLETALALARRSVGLAPTNTRVLANLGALQIRAGQTEEGLATLARAVEVWRTDTTLIPYANALVERGRIDEARVLAEEVVALRPGLAYIRLWQAGLAWRGEDYPAALDACREALVLDLANVHAAELAASCEAALALTAAPASSGPRGARRLAGMLRRGYRRMARARAG